MRAMQILEKQARSGEDLYARPAVKPTTAASAQMTIEALESGVIQVVDR